jgi:hypothetical protein
MQRLPSIVSHQQRNCYNTTPHRYCQWAICAVLCAGGCLAGLNLSPGDVHADMQHAGAIERIILERHRQRTALLQRHQLTKAYPAAHDLSRRDEFAGNIDARDLAAITVCGEPGRAAKPATDIEHMHGR